MSKYQFSISRSNILDGPGKNKEVKFNSSYKPVDCDFTDELEFAVVKKLNVEVHFKKENEEISSVSGKLVDIFTQNKEEFLKISDGTLIRLDHIMEVRILDPEETEQNCNFEMGCEIKKR